MKERNACDIVRKRMQEIGVCIKQLARYMNMSEHDFKRYLHSKTCALSYLDLRKLCDVLNIDVEDVLHEDT